MQGRRNLREKVITSLASQTNRFILSGVLKHFGLAINSPGHPYQHFPTACQNEYFERFKNVSKTFPPRTVLQDDQFTALRIKY